MIIIVHIQRTVLGRKWEYLCKMLTMISDQKILAVITSVFKTTITNAFFMSPLPPRYGTSYLDLWTLDHKTEISCKNNFRDCDVVPD